MSLEKAFRIPISRVIRLETLEASRALLEYKELRDNVIHRLICRSCWDSFLTVVRTLSDLCQLIGSLIDHCPGVIQILELSLEFHYSLYNDQNWPIKCEKSRGADGFFFFRTPDFCVIVSLTSVVLVQATLFVGCFRETVAWYRWANDFEGNAVFGLRQHGHDLEELDNGAGPAVGHHQGEHLCLQHARIGYKYRTALQTTEVSLLHCAHLQC